jgi:hypothetical protein
VIPYFRVWLLAILTAVAMTVCSETVFRRQGLMVSTATDNVDLWVKERTRLAAAGPQAIVLIGASRIQLGVDIDTFARETGIRPIQLAINGNSPLPVLEHLAKDARFRGFVICSFTGAGPDPTGNANTARNWIHAYEQSKQTSTMRVFYAELEESLRRLTRKFITPRPELFLPERQLGRIFLGKDTATVRIQINDDRSIKVDYLGSGAAAARHVFPPATRELTEKPISVAEYLARARTVEPWVDAIQQRGGRVIFVRFPSGGKRWEQDEANYPRTKYWNAFARQTRGVALHFADYPQLSRFMLPDESHLDYRDTVPFTQSLTHILRPYLQRQISEDSN